VERFADTRNYEYMVWLEPRVLKSRVGPRIVDVVDGMLASRGPWRWWEVLMKTEFWVDFPMPANQFVTKARLELRTDATRLISLSQGRVAPLPLHD
jgi:hypothetical protein